MTVAVVALPALVAPAVGADLAPSTTLLAAVVLARRPSRTAADVPHPAAQPPGAADGPA